MVSVADRWASAYLGRYCIVLGALPPSGRPSSCEGCWALNAGSCSPLEIPSGWRPRYSRPSRSGSWALFATFSRLVPVQLAITELIPPRGRNLGGVAAWFAIALVAVSWEGSPTSSSWRRGSEGALGHRA